jgi:hypothetical protein
MNLNVLPDRLDPALQARIDDFKALILAAHDELHAAIEYHEAWRPSAYDPDLHQRLNGTFAANTFLIVRQALRRELLMSLMRMWDSDDRAIRMTKIRDELKDKTILDALDAEVQRGVLGIEQIIYEPEDAPEEEKAIALAAALASQRRYAQQLAGEMRASAKEARQIINYYQDGKGKALREQMARLRHQHLAHRQYVNTAPATIDDDAVEVFYKDMMHLVHLLTNAVRGMDCRHDAIADIQAKNAKLFWNGVRGETTEGHPDFGRKRRLAQPS